MPDISHLNSLIEDAEQALRSGDTGPPDPTDYHRLMGRLVSARDSLPPIYTNGVWEPYVASLRQIGDRGFTSALLQDPGRESIAGLLLDPAHAILQNAEGYEHNATDAFQEVVADLYDGFLSAEDRRGVKPPDKGTLAPLVKWGRPDFGPYTFTINATERLGLKSAIVSMPPANARGGLLAWAALPHEVAGHDLMHADNGLHEELQRKVRKALSGFDPGIANYWANRIDETASDVMGVMNMGPAAAIGLIGYFRSLQSTSGRERRLSSVGAASGPHPADLLRGYLAAAALSHCEAAEASAWSQTLQDETDKDAGNGVAILDILPGPPPRVVTTLFIPIDKARESAQKVAEAIATESLNSLEGSSISDIQNWRHEDEIITRFLMELLPRNQPIPPSLLSGVYAAHVVAAAVLSALKGNGTPQALFARMGVMLKQMHDRNPTWSALPISNFGDVTLMRLTGGGASLAPMSPQSDGSLGADHFGWPIPWPARWPINWPRSIAGVEELEVSLSPNKKVSKREK